MRRFTLVAASAAAMLVLSGCYHATVNTGMTPGNQTIHEPWAKSFVYGLVPPETIEAMDQCSGGVARVETRHSFLNGLVGALTWGIFTPMDILVTCAAGDDDDAAAAAADPTAVPDATNGSDASGAADAVDATEAAESLGAEELEAVRDAEAFQRALLRGEPFLVYLW
jgi:hypothetical protein